MKYVPRIWLIVLALLIYSCASVNNVPENQNKGESRLPFKTKSVRSAQKLAALHFTQAEIDTMYQNLIEMHAGYLEMHTVSLDNTVTPALHFDPRPDGFAQPTEQMENSWTLSDEVQLPAERDALAFYSIAQLSSLVRRQKISSEALTRFFLERLKTLDGALSSVVTITEEMALEQARKADQEIAAGNYRGPLHGIPYGAKDILAVPGYRTTWGAAPFREQVRPETAAVVHKLEQAGAVLIAKLVTGELANGDVWFGGKTKNPWDLTQGARGSSAGPGAATAAGLVPFSIGTETWGSIIGPSSRCGLSGLRPTYGRVSRYGCMTLAWSLDKIGPMCRSAEDCALVFEALHGIDPRDRATVDFPFRYDPKIAQRKLYIGFPPEITQDSSETGQLENAALALIKELGMELVQMELPADLDYSHIMSLIIRAEAGAAFDQLVLTNADDQLARNGSRSRANSLRRSRFIPAVEYIQANRHRSELMKHMDSIFQKYDLLIFPPRGTDQSAITNMTGHPALSLPVGFDEKGRPHCLVLLGRLYDEATLLALAARYQELTEFEGRRPEGF